MVVLMEELTLTSGQTIGPKRSRPRRLVGTKSWSKRSGNMLSAQADDYVAKPFDALMFDALLFGAWCWRALVLASQGAGGSGAGSASLPPAVYCRLVTIYCGGCLDLS